MRRGPQRTTLPTLSQATYMVECYWPGITAELLRPAADRARKTALDLTREGSAVRYLGSVLVPKDEVVFLFFDGVSLDVVRRLGMQAELPFERISRSIKTEEPRDQEGG
jgi:hypothetical protein